MELNKVDSKVGTLKSRSSWANTCKQHESRGTRVANNVSKGRQQVDIVDTTVVDCPAKHSHCTSQDLHAYSPSYVRSCPYLIHELHG
eukprot:scaffold5239_cov34-Prasinocladus_malaysianus.AAC.2